MRRRFAASVVLTIAACGPTATARPATSKRPTVVRKTAGARRRRVPAPTDPGGCTASRAESSLLDVRTDEADARYINPADVGDFRYGDHLAVAPIVDGGPSVAMVAGVWDDHRGTRDQAGVVDLYGE
jgi:hypothetical protein